MSGIIQKLIKALFFFQFLQLIVWQSFQSSLHNNCTFKNMSKSWKTNHHFFHPQLSGTPLQSQRSLHMRNHNDISRFLSTIVSYRLLYVPACSSTRGWFNRTVQLRKNCWSFWPRVSSAIWTDLRQEMNRSLDAVRVGFITLHYNNIIIE